MILFEHVSLASGQSYEDANVLEEGDYAAYGIQKLFGSLTLAFLAQGQCVIANQWNIRVMRLDRRERTGRKAVPFERFIIDRDILFQKGAIIDSSEYADLGIPQVIGAGLTQIAWSTADGVMISHDANVVSVILKDPRGGNTDKVVIRSTSFRGRRAKRGVSGGKITRS